MTENTTAVKHPNVLAIRSRIAALLAGNDADQQLAEFAEKLLGVIEGTPNELTDEINRELAEEVAEPWRYDPRIEALECLHSELGSLIDEMAAAKYVSLPQEVRDADAARHSAARERRRIANAASYCPEQHRQRLTGMGYPADIIEEAVEARATA